MMSGIMESGIENQKLPEVTPHEKAHIKTDEQEIRSADAVTLKADEAEIPAETVMSMKAENMKDLDTNGDGVLDQKEITAQLVKIMSTLNVFKEAKLRLAEKPALKNLFKTLDKDHDGYLDEEEVLGSGSVGSSSSSTFEQLADQDGDGKLDLNELFYIGHPEFAPEKEAFYRIKALDHMEAMDKNKDNKVSWDEYLAAEQAHLDAYPKRKKEMLKDEKALFEHAAEGRKELNYLGMLRLIRDKSSKYYYEKVAKKMIKLGDDNNDGTISLQEIIKHATQFGTTIQQFVTFAHPEFNFFFKTNRQHKAGLALSMHLPSKQDALKGYKQHISSIHSKEP